MAIGFHFIEQPDVASKINFYDSSLEIILSKFYSKTLVDDNGNEYKNFETLASIFIDKNYDGQNFIMTDYYFANDLKIIDDNIIINLNKIGNTDVMIIYTDIFGNEFTEIKKCSGDLNER